MWGCPFSMCLSSGSLRVLSAVGVLEDPPPAMRWIQLRCAVSLGFFSFENHSNYLDCVWLSLDLRVSEGRNVVGGFCFGQFFFLCFCTTLEEFGLNFRVDFLVGFCTYVQVCKLLHLGVSSISAVGL